MSATDPRLPSRRDFLQNVSAGAALLALADWRAIGGETARDSSAARSTANVPWYRQTYRWGQTNLTELDPTRFDLAWWRAHWKRTHVQGVVINAGGIVAYYPTEVPFHKRAKNLGTRDFFGDLAKAAHDDGLAVFARMDSNRADETFYRAHPDWFAHDAAGQPYKATGLYVACVNSPYYDQHIPAILREVATRYRPEGFTDNNWNGPMRHQPCFCPHCERKFRARTGQPVPRAANWNDRLYRDWIMWNYERRLEIWDLFNRTTRDAGGADCIWVGMMAGSQNWQSRVFRDDREVYRRTELVMLDHQRRFDEDGFQDNGEIGKRIRSVGGWDKIIPESMAMYQLGERNFRLAAKPEPEARLWVLEGLAGGVQPWWHHLGGEQHDQRMLKTAQPLWQWHRDHEQYLIHRRPVATVGVLWSQRNMDFFGRDHGGPHVDDPRNGFMQALVRARVPYVPVHVDDIERETAELGLRTLILPNLAALSDPQVAAIRQFVAGGGNLLATGLSSLCNEWGDVRDDFALADILGVHVPPTHAFRDETKRTQWARDWSHTYLRLSPELRARGDGPRTGDEPAATGARHEVLRGFDETDLLPFGGLLEPLTVDAGAIVPLTFVPPFPQSPPEDVWMREPKTDIPALVLRERPNGSRIAYLPADVDRRFARDNLPDHGDLLASLVRWTAKDDFPLRVEGRGLVDCHLYRFPANPRQLVLHLVNLTNASTWRTPVHELVPLGPFRVTVRRSFSTSPSVRSLVSSHSVPCTYVQDTLTFEIGSILDHEVLLIE